MSVHVISSTGGIVWSRCHGNNDQPVRPDTRTWPLPWIAADVLVCANADACIWSVAADGEQGEVVIRQRYPYQALTVWHSEGFGTGRLDWHGDMQRWKKYFTHDMDYMQGDAAVRHADASYTFHGRSDEVINVGGNRIGTEEIESALLADTEREDSTLRKCAVVGMPDETLGTVPVAFIVLLPSVSFTAADEGRCPAALARRPRTATPPPLLWWWLGATGQRMGPARRTAAALWVTAARASRPSRSEVARIS